MASRALGQDLPVGLELGHYRIAKKLGACSQMIVVIVRDKYGVYRRQIVNRER